MRRIALSVLALLVLTFGISADQKKLYLKRPIVKASLSKAEQENIATAIQSKLTIIFLERGSYSVVNDDDLSTLLEEAEMKAALDCDSDECIMAVADTVGAPYIVRTVIRVLGKGNARIDAQLSERTAGGALRIVSGAEVPEVDLSDEEEINWYVREITNKLHSLDYQIKTYLAGSVNVRIDLSTAENIQISALPGPLKRPSPSLPEVKVEPSGDAAKQVSSILKKAISEADSLAQDLKLEDAEEAYRQVQDKARRYTIAYPEMAAFETVVLNRIGELSRLKVEQLISSADSLQESADQIEAYKKAEKCRLGVEKRYATVISSYGKLIFERISAVHRRAVKALLDAGDGQVGIGKPREAVASYLEAWEYLEKNRREIEKGGSEVAPFISQRLLLGYSGIMDSSIRQAERNYMDYKFTEAEDAFADAIQTAKSCPLFANVASRKKDKATAEEAQFLDLWQTAETGAKKSRETALNIFRNQSSVDKDMVIIMDARDERKSADAKLDEMGSRIGTSRYRDDPTALGHLRTACKVLGREMNALLLASPAVREIVSTWTGQVQPGYAYIQVLIDDAGFRRGIQASTLTIDGGKEKNVPSGWIPVPEGNRKATVGSWDVGLCQWQGSLKAGHFYKLVAYPPFREEEYLATAEWLPGYAELPLPDLLPMLGNSEGLAGHKPLPPMPTLLPETRKQRMIEKQWIPAGGLLGALLGAIGGYLLVEDDVESALGGGAMGLAIGSLIIDLPLNIFTPTGRIVALPRNVVLNQERRSAWDARVKPIQEHNQRLIDEENRKRSARNSELQEEYHVKLVTVAKANLALLSEANNKIRAKNLVIQELNEGRGKIDVTDIGFYDIKLNTSRE